jgi:hypothetical protein
MREIHLIVRRPLEIQRDERGFVGIGAEQEIVDLFGAPKSFMPA